jgi:hypothetical protein
VADASYDCPLSFSGDVIRDSLPEALAARAACGALASEAVAVCNSLGNEPTALTQAAAPFKKKQALRHGCGTARQRAHATNMPARAKTTQKAASTPVGAR